MRLTLVAVGKVSEPFLREACGIFAEKLRRYAPLNLIVIPEEKIPSRGKTAYILHQEAKRIREKIRPDFFTVVVDERGKPLSSQAFARALEKWSQSGFKELAFVIGGPYGLDETLRSEADFCLSLSTMTMTHGMARMFLLEQIYRACTILKGQPYHK